MERPSRVFILHVLVLSLLWATGHGAALSSVLSHPRTALNLNASTFTNSSLTATLSNRNHSAIYHPLFAQHRNDTPRFINATKQNVNPLVPAALGIPGHSLRRDVTALPEGACAPGSPCVNGACCSKVCHQNIQIHLLLGSNIIRKVGVDTLQSIVVAVLVSRT